MVWVPMFGYGLASLHAQSPIRPTWAGAGRIFVPTSAGPYDLAGKARVTPLDAGETIDPRVQRELRKIRGKKAGS